jgi:hypothetical protein
MSSITHLIGGTAVALAVALSSAVAVPAQAGAQPGPPCGFGQCRGPGGGPGGFSGPGGPGHDRGPGGPGVSPPPPRGMEWRGIDQGRFDHQPFNYRGNWVTPVFNPDFRNWGFWFLGVWIPL